MGQKGAGKGLAFLRSLIGTVETECVTWPMCRDANNGYGRLGINGKRLWAHRAMCALAHGEPPTPRHEASHSCGKGQDGCVNPNHLAWKTASENQKDRRRHGTANTNPWGRRGKLTKEQKRRICELRPTHTLVELGRMFGVPFQTISRIEREGANQRSSH